MLQDKLKSPPLTEAERRLIYRAAEETLILRDVVHENLQRLSGSSEALAIYTLAATIMLQGRIANQPEISGSIEGQLLDPSRLSEAERETLRRNLRKLAGGDER